MHYATQDNLILPKGQQGPLYVENDRDYIFGSSPLSAPDLCLDENWLPTAEKIEGIHEIQKIADGRDLWWCVQFSGSGQRKVIHQLKYGYPIDEDEKFGAVGSGTIPYQGVSIKDSLDFRRKSGFLYERKEASDLTWEEAWAPNTEAEKEEALKNNEDYDFGYEFLPRLWNGVNHLPDSDPEVLHKACRKAPPMVTVDPNYILDDEGRVGAGYNGKLMNYYHEALLLGPHYTDGYVDWWTVLDSETKQFLKFQPNYRFGYCSVSYLTKKKMKIYRKIGQKAIGFLNESGDGLYLWGDGQDNRGFVSGGSIFKSLGLNYKLAKTVDEWPFPIIGQHTIKPIDYQGGKDGDEKRIS